MTINFTSPLPAIEENDRFPDDIAYGSSGGPGFLSEVVENDSGFETRFERWERAKCKFSVKEAVKTPDQYSRLLTYFWAMRGRLKGFRFKDWSDFTSAPVQFQNNTPSATDQVIGTGDGTTAIFQLVKTYPEAGGVVRTINKPVVGTTLIALDDTIQSSGWSVDTTTGLVTFDTPPADGAVVTAGFEFDVPCRFDIDELQMTFDGFEEVSSDITLVEIFLFKEFYSRMIFSIEPAVTVCGTGLGTVEVTVPSDLFTGPVTVALATNPNGATLGGTLTQNAVAGVASFDDLYLDKAGTYRLSTTATDFSSGMSDSFTTTAGQFAVCTSRANATLQNSSPANIPADSAFGLLMSWYKSGSAIDISGLNPIVQWNEDGLSLYDSTGAIILTVSGVPTTTDDWYQDILSWNTAGNVIQWMRDGTDIIGSCTVNWSSTNTVHYSGTTTIDIGSHPSSGDFSDNYFWAPSSFFDLSVADNLALLRDGTDPMPLDDGSTVGLFAWVALHGSASSYATNIGTGGDFTVLNPPLLPADTSPWNVHVRYTGTVFNKIMFDDAIDGGWDGVTPLLLSFTVETGAIVGSVSTSQIALQTGTGFPVGTTLVLVVDGEIEGCGGNGGATNSGTVGLAGGDGGHALKAEFPITVTNNNRIYGGGGGGGSGALNGVNGGGGGGGGAGTLGGIRGSTGGPGNGYGTDGTATAGGIAQNNTGSGTPGGAGGGPGERGVDGQPGAATGGVPVYPGGAGGAPGKYIIGNDKVTWALLGDVRGSVG